MTRFLGLFEDLSLRKTIAIALIVGLALPVGISAWLHLSERRLDLLQRLHADHARILEVLAFGMRTPLWEIRSDSGQPLIDALMLDERVAAIHVTSPLVPRFLTTEMPRRRQGEALLLETPVMYNDEEIGRVRVEMDTGRLESLLAEQWTQILWTGLLQFGVGIIIIFALLGYKVIKPLQRLIGQSGALASGILDQPLQWRRRDELGVLGRSFEKMRSSLGELVSNLETRNRDLQDREAELASQASLLQATLDNMTDGITLVDEHLYLVAWNDRLIEMMTLPPQLFYQGVSLEELIRFDLARGGHDPVDRETIVRALRQIYQPGQESSTRYCTSQNRLIDIHRRSMPGGGFVNTYTDVTEQVEAQRKADETRLMLEAIMDAVPAGLSVKDLKMRYQLVNRQFLQWLGCEREQVLGKVCEDLFDADVCRRQDVRERKVIATGEPSPFEEMPFSGERGPVAIWTTNVPLRDANGRVTHLLTVELDISERRRAEAELARHREALHQSEKLTALGSLLAGVAHELNNPLSVVVGRSIMLEDQLRDTHASKSVSKVRAAAERCARIVKTFLAMARQQESTRAPMRIEEAIEGSLEMMGYGLRAAGIEVSLDLELGLPMITADLDQLTQVFTNVFANARHALEGMPEPRQLRVSARLDRSANGIKVRVGDNGPGIPAEIRSRIFEPFFTTKAVGEGTGVGLSVSHSIIQAHGGTIAMEAPAAGGTVFDIYLPLDTITAPEVLEAPAGSSASHGSRVLVVDDEPEVAHMLADILATAGHRVETAANGRMALRQLEDCDFDLILSDLRMPDLDGPRLYAALDVLNPNLCKRVIFVTGDTLGEAAKRFLMESGRPVIEKPFVPNEVRYTVDQVLKGLDTFPF